MKRPGTTPGARGDAPAQLDQHHEPGAAAARGLGHLWFVTCILSMTAPDASPGPSATCCWLRADGSPQRFAACRRNQRERKAYYEILERTQKGDTMSPWLLWFLADVVSCGEPGYPRWMRY
jgi:hypothetical protein